MSDIVERLRTLATTYGIVDMSVVVEAAAEIERLRAALKSSVQNICWMSAASDFGPDGQAREGWVKVREETWKHEALARAALKGQS